MEVDPADFDDLGWLTAECRKLSENARLIRLSLQARLQDAPTRTAFVCWSPGGSSDRRSEPVEMEGVTVIPGPGLPAWLDDELGQPQSPMMDGASIESARKTLEVLARNTDRRDFKETGIPPATPVRHLFDAGIGLLAGLLAFSLAALLFRWHGPALLFPMLLVLIAAALAFYLSKRMPFLVRIIGLGATVGFGSSLVVSAALYVYVGLTHL